MSIYDHVSISPVGPRRAGAPKGSESSRFCLAEWERGDGRAVGPPHARSGGGGLLPRRLVTVLQPAVAGLSAKTAGAARAWRPARRHLAAAAWPIAVDGGEERAGVRGAER